MWPLLGLGRRRRVVLLQVEEGLAWGRRGAVCYGFVWEVPFRWSGLARVALL